MRMHNPPHLGETLKQDVLPALGLSVTEATEQLVTCRPVLGAERTRRDQRRNADPSIAVDGRQPRGVATRPVAVRSVAG